MSPETVKVRLKSGRERPVVHGHPWIFSGAIDAWQSEPAIGGCVDVLARDGTWLARGLAHPQAALAIRLYTRNEKEAVDGELFARRIRSALQLRKILYPPAELEKTDAMRLVYSEADGLSGLIVDRYADLLAVRVSARALLPHLENLLAVLRAETGVERIQVSAEPDAVEREGLDAAVVEKFSSPGELRTVIRQDGMRFEVDLQAGQKTGFFLDQRQNRRRVANYAAGRRVLSAYCYTGAFEIYAAAAGAKEITGLDRSDEALVQARRQFELNGLAGPADYRKADVPLALRKFRDEGRNFDLIILDPPRFVFSQAGKDKGLRAYKDINLLALKLLAPGGILATFSCSGLVSAEELKTVLAWAAQDTGLTVRILETLGQPPDHPILPGFPESEYLKGLICVVERN